MACEVQEQHRTRRVVRKERFAFNLGQRAAALEALREWMGSNRVAGWSSTSRRTSQEWVLGIADVRYLLLQWTPDLADQTLREAFAAALFEQQFKQSPDLYAVRFAGASYGCPQLVAFVAKDLVAELDAHEGHSNIKLTSLMPSVAAVWERFHVVLARERGTLCVVDGDRQVILHHVGNQVEEIALRPYDADRIAPTPGLRRDGRRPRVFSANPPQRDGRDDSLSLADGEGFLTTQDSAYAFALCGVF